MGNDLRALRLTGMDRMNRFLGVGMSWCRSVGVSLFCVLLLTGWTGRQGRDGTKGRPDRHWGRTEQAEFNVADLPNIVDWWRIERGMDGDSSGTAADSGESVFFWYGSINNTKLAQGTETNRPQYRTDQLNGNPAIVFNGSDNFMQTDSLWNLSQPNTIILVSTVPNALYDNLFDGLDATHRHALIWYTTPLFRMNAGITQIVNTIVPGSGWKIFTALYNGASSYLRQNGTQGSVVGDISTNVLIGLTLAGNNAITNFANISVTDLIVVDGELSAADLQNVESYLNRLRGGIY